MASNYRWTFKRRIRPRAFGWRGSNSAIIHLNQAVAEIRAVAGSDAILAADGIVTLAERLWPALQDIDSSSGALGAAVNRALDALLPILIEAAAAARTRSKWLGRLFQAVEEDGVQFLMPIEERWGEIAVYLELMVAYADLLLPLIRRIWTDKQAGGYVLGTTICLSCLLEAGRYGDLLELLSCSDRKWWSWHRFGAEALARQGLWHSAIAYAESCRDPRLAPYDDRQIDRFCEQVLIKAGCLDQAYQQHGLTAAKGSTFLAVYRETVRNYPDRSTRQILLDLIGARGQRGKWFAAAKSAGFFDIALECAANNDAERATLVRAARDFADANPEFTAKIALLALGHLIAGRGYEPNPLLIDQAVDHLLAASSRIGARQWATDHLTRLFQEPDPSGRDVMRRVLAARLERDDVATSPSRREDTVPNDQPK
jgi:hypothetical protein